MESDAMTTGRTSKKEKAQPKLEETPRKKKDAVATRRNILDEALLEFSHNGFSGARVDRIASNTHTSKRMIYYYFESKEGLYHEVLKESYKQLRQLEENFHLEDLPPMLGLRKLVESTVDYHASHSDFIRLIMTENIHKGRNIRQMPELKSVNRKVIQILEDICGRGIEEGIFRPNLDPVKLHENISALAFFNVSNRYTFGFLFDRDFADGKIHAARREEIVDMISRYVRA
jgi:AcrR family transcriptional regulator